MNVLLPSREDEEETRSLAGEEDAAATAFLALVGDNYSTTSMSIPFETSIAFRSIPTSSSSSLSRSPPALAC